MSSKGHGVPFLQQWTNLFRSACPRLGILVVGVTGSGKSTLINNLLGESVAKEGHSVQSETSTVTAYDGTINNVEVRIYDTPGLGDSRKDRADKAYLKKIKGVLKRGEIHIVIYCFKMTETRLQHGLIRTFQEYQKIGISWERTLIALTFADALTAPYAKEKETGFTKKDYFNERLTEWRKEITEVLAEQVKVKESSLLQLKITPTTDNRKREIPDGGNWFNTFLLEMVELLPPYAMIKFIDIHKKNIVLDADVMSSASSAFSIPPPPPDYLTAMSQKESVTTPSTDSDQGPKIVLGERESEKFQADGMSSASSAFPIPPPPPDDLAAMSLKESVTTPSTDSDEGSKIVLDKRESEKFQETVAKKLDEGVSLWSVTKGVGVVAAGATALVAGVAAAPTIAIAAAGTAFLGAASWLISSWW